MKRYLYLAFIFAWVLCMGSIVFAMDTNEDNPVMETTSIKVFSELKDPGFDLLLSGVNVLSGQPLRRGGGVKNSLLTPVGKAALEELNQIVGIRQFTGGGFASCTFTAVSTIDELAESRGFGKSVDMSASARIAFIASISNEFNAKLAYAGNTTFKNAHETFIAVMEIQRDAGRNSITDPNSLRAHNSAIWAAMTPDARAALTSGSIQNLFNNWGTHVIKSYSLGGQAQTFTTIARTEKSSNIYSKISSAVGVGFSIEAVSLDFGLNLNKTTSDAAETLRSEYNFQVDSWSTVTGGGGGFALALNPKSGINDYEKWINSIEPDHPEDTTAIIINDQLELVGIWELLPPQPQYEARRAEIQKVYLESLTRTYKEYYNNYVFSQPLIDTPPPPVDGVTLISTAQDLDNIRNNLNGQFLLTNDIDLSGYSAWTPIGTETQPFRGTVHGNGNTVRNVSVNTGVEPGNTAPGLFGYNEGTIQYLGVEYNSRFSGNVAGVTRAPGSVVGSEASFAYKGTLLNNPHTITTINSPDITVSNPFVLIDFSKNAVLAVDSTITVDDTVHTIVFRGNPDMIQNYTGLNIVVEGNTTVVFENFRFTGSTRGSAIRFNGSNPVIISTKSGPTDYNLITGSGEHPTIRAANNLFIGGDVDLTVNHSLTQTTGAAGAAGQNAIHLTSNDVGNSTLTIAMTGATLIAEASVGRRGTHYESAAATGNPGSNGGDGGAGGTGGHAISAMKLDILINSRVELRGGQGGNGGQGQHGGSGNNATNSPNTVGRNGGLGGLGGLGGKGGNALDRVTLANFMMSPRAYIKFIAGAGGTGGNAGDGGNGGNGLRYTTSGKDAETHTIRGGNGGNARNPGEGGGSGSFAEFSLRSLSISPNESTGRGNDGATGTGGRAGSYGGSPGTNQGTRRSDDPGVIVAERPAGESAWFNPNRLIIHEAPAASTFYQGMDVFDPTGYRFSVPMDYIDFHFDFSKLGINLVTAIYRIPGFSSSIRYIPVMVIEPIIEAIEIRPPRISFSVGDRFTHEGHLLEVHYSDRSIQALTDRLNISLPAGHVFNQTGHTEITVTSPELPSWSSSYILTVQERNMDGGVPTVLVSVETRPLPGASDGNVTLPAGTVIETDGSIILPPDAGATIYPPNDGPEIWIPGGSVIDPDGTIILGETDGRITTSGGLEVGISGGSIRVEADGSIILLDNVTILNDEVTITFSKGGRGRVWELAAGDMVLVVEQGSATVSSNDANVEDVLVAAGYEIKISQDGSIAIAKSVVDNKNSRGGDGGGGCQLTGYLLVLLSALLLLIKRRA